MICLNFSMRGFQHKICSCSLKAQHRAVGMDNHASRTGQTKFFMQQLGRVNAGYIWAIQTCPICSRADIAMQFLPLHQ